MLQTLVQEVLEGLFADLTAALPRVVAGLIFLVVAVVLVKSVLFVIRSFLGRTLPGDSPVYRQFIVTIVAAVLWFGVGLSFLSVVGLTAIAAALGTATGFLALGVSYALSGMLADAVAGVYLLRDPDFQLGDTITADEVTGEVVAIELRKTRIRVDDDLVVRANEDIEQEWRKHGAEAA